MQSSQAARCHLTVLNVLSHNEMKWKALGMSSSRVSSISSSLFWGVAGNCWRDTHKDVHSTVQGVAGKCNETLSEGPCLNNAKEENSFQVDLQKLVQRQDGYRTTSTMKDLKQESVSNVFSEASKRTIKEMGMEDQESNWHHLRSFPLYVIKQGTRGERHGPEDWQYHHWKARDATTAKRWKDDLSHRETQRKHGWTLEYCIFLDYLKTVKIDYKATWDERNRHKNQFVLRCKDEKNPGKMSIQDDFKQAAKSLATASHQEGTGNAYVPPSGRFRDWPIDEPSRSHLRWQCRNWPQFDGSQASSSSSTTWWEAHQWQGRQDWHGWQEWDEWVQISWAAKSFCNFICQSFFFG